MVVYVQNVYTRTHVSYIHPLEVQREEGLPFHLMGAFTDCTARPHANPSSFDHGSPIFQLGNHLNRMKYYFFSMHVIIERKQSYLFRFACYHIVSFLAISFTRSRIW
ncbi:hypothetical protein EUGRSUZ_I00993 [Eucalyptus grandis]|uniref:Uncharacterized protein n=2 Tax=Eucalyptus grandis TaxID=71139 RepID=A0ACC3JDS3_EUCGR|nr:hypothetical protein EUGRSUZ_I00993 [Eucalyptus grandis]